MIAGSISPNTAERNVAAGICVAGSVGSGLVRVVSLLGPRRRWRDCPRRSRNEVHGWKTGEMFQSYLWNDKLNRGLTCHLLGESLAIILEARRPSMVV